MKQLQIINELMTSVKTSPRPFINHNNELILVPKFNVYFMLDNIYNETDVKVKLCEYFSRDCCCALRYSSEKRLNQYYQDNTDTFNKICGTNFTIEDMNTIYAHFGNGIKHEKAYEFVMNDFDLLRILLGA